MWSSIKSFFGISDESKDQPQLSDAEIAANEIKRAQATLDKLRDELIEVETAVKDSRKLVSKVETQQESFKIALANLEMECHDEYLHPVTEEEKEITPPPQSPSAKPKEDDDDDVPSSKKSTSTLGGVRAQLKKSIHVLETLYLPQIEMQRDNLDLTAFRLSLRLTKLKAEEGDARRRLLSLQAEAHERYDKYRVSVDDNTNNTNSNNDNDDENNVVDGDAGAIIHPDGEPNIVSIRKDNKNKKNRNHNNVFNANDMIPRPLMRSSSSSNNNNNNEDDERETNKDDDDYVDDREDHNTSIVDDECYHDHGRYKNNSNSSVIPDLPPPELVIKK